MLQRNVSPLHARRRSYSPRCLFSATDYLGLDFNLALEGQLSYDAGFPLWPARKGRTFMRQVTPLRSLFPALTQSLGFCDENLQALG